MDIDVIATAVCSGLETAQAMILASDPPEYDQLAGRFNLSSVKFEHPYEPEPHELVECAHDEKHVLVEVGLEDRLPEHYAVANVYVATHDVSSYDAEGLSLDTIYTLDLYLWRDLESAESIERKLIVVAHQVLRALKAAPLEWELHPQQVDWATGTAQNAQAHSYRVARFSIAATQYVEP